MAANKEKSAASQRTHAKISFANSGPFIMLLCRNFYCYAQHGAECSAILFYICYINGCLVAQRNI